MKEGKAWRGTGIQFCVEVAAPLDGPGFSPKNAPSVEVHMRSTGGAHGLVSNSNFASGSLPLDGYEDALLLMQDQTKILYLTFLASAVSKGLPP